MGFYFPDGHTINFYGMEVVEYYIKRFLLYFSDYAVHIRMLYGLIVVCILTMIMLFIMFIMKIKESYREKTEYDSANKHLRNGFYQILISPERPSVEDVEKACIMPLDEIQKYRPEILSKLISEICMDLSRELGNIPNTSTLCSMVGVKSLYERNLATSHFVIQTLQNLANMHIPVSEGLLAIYINHYDDNIRHMARICHVISSNSDPYRYFMEDLSETQGLWRFMMLHRLFGWLKANERQMPQFVVLAEKLQNEDSVAFLIQEVAYWGSENEKKSLHNFFLSPNYKYRAAALHAMSILRDKTQEKAAVESYDQQPEQIRQEVLKAVYAVNSGDYSDFFVQAFRSSTSKETREIALTCLYTYGHDGRQKFELLRWEVINDMADRKLMDQIDSLAILNQMRKI